MPMQKSGRLKALASTLNTRGVLFCGALILAGMAVMVASFFRVQGRVLQQERQQIQTIARSTASSIDNYVTGCMSGVALLEATPFFYDAVQAFRAGGLAQAERLHDCMFALTASHDSGITDCYLADAGGNLLVGTAPVGAVRLVVGDGNTPGDGKIRVYVKNDSVYCLGIFFQIDADNYLLCLLAADGLYRYTASFVTLGKKGYVMLKHSSGVIITHPVPEQIGIDVLEGRKAMNPNLDYSDLQRLVANQKKGRDGIEIYHSYWWADEVPSRVRKISAYTPIRIQNDFLIVSAVTDYAEMLEPVLGNSVVMAAAAVLVASGVAGLLLLRHREIERQIQRENAYLKELNLRQEQTQHSQRLQMIGTLTGGIAHEFRNLLTPIMGYSGMMRETLPPDSPFRADADEIYTAAVRAKEIIQQVTSLSRKNLEPTLKPARPDDMLPPMLRVAMTSKPPAADCHIALDFSGKAILCNKTQINQIIINLCNNAFQALPDGRGNVWVDGTIQHDGAGEYAVLTIRDDGVGMRQEVVEQIFDPFFTTKRVGEGTGLGLAVVQNIVDLHHGDIRVESAPASGSTVTVRFPVTAESNISGKLPLVAVRQREEPISVVLVEDDPKVLRLLHRGLAKNAFSTQPFSNPEEALAEIRKNPCDLLITDYILPGMTGAELARTVRRDVPSVKILVLTGFADAEIKDDVKNGILDGYQIKPVPVSELVERIDALFME